MKIKYIDNRKMYIPSLSFYPNGIALPNKDNIIEVTEGEFKSLLKSKNGNKDCWEEMKPIRRNIIKEESTQVEEV